MNLTSTERTIEQRRLTTRTQACCAQSPLERILADCQQFSQIVQMPVHSNQEKQVRDCLGIAASGDAHQFVALVQCLLADLRIGVQRGSQQFRQGNARLLSVVAVPPTIQPDGIADRFVGIFDEAVVHPGQQRVLPAILRRSPRRPSRNFSNAFPANRAPDRVRWWAHQDSNLEPRDSLYPEVSPRSGLSLHPRLAPVGCGTL